jgi:hypothetical protein
LLLLLAWVIWNSSMLAVTASKFDIYQMLCVQFWATDDGRRSHLEHVEHWQQSRILCNVASCWLYLKEYINDAWSHERRHPIEVSCCTGSCVSKNYHSPPSTSQILQSIDKPYLCNATHYLHIYHHLCTW